MKSKRRSYLKLVIAFISAILLFSAIFYGMRLIENHLLNEDEQDATHTDNPYGVVEYKEKTYKPYEKVCFIVAYIDDCRVRTVSYVLLRKSGGPQLWRL